MNLLCALLFKSKHAKHLFRHNLHSFNMAPLLPMCNINTCNGNDNNNYDVMHPEQHSTLLKGLLLHLLATLRHNSRTTPAHHSHILQSTWPQQGHQATHLISMIGLPMHDQLAE
mmetsp:Transcript_55276/g.165652  ORF Transcript_55276/g.165652 Transcript_55276/m.165652 type:complete len:114 (-) Transcript_55276:2255-2596(-)